MDNSEIKNRSRQASIISLIGFILIFIAFLYAGVKLNSLNKTIKLKSQELNKQDSILISQKNEIEFKQKVITELIDELGKYKSSKITVNSNAVKLSGIFDLSGRQIYDFTIWLTSSEETIGFIEKVTYKFGHDSFLLNERESTEPSNGFLISYRGWGCLELMEIFIEYKDQENEIIYFEMCNSLSKFNENKDQNESQQISVKASQSARDGRSIDPTLNAPACEQDIMGIEQFFAQLM